MTILVTIFCSVPIIIAGIVKLLLPVPVIWRKVSRFCDFMMIAGVKVWRYYCI
ncbi:hypothetical protein ECDEC9B_4658 [Escherichia coli DEC9B]|nr:hypothetical protein ECDEC9B_4658 [Escherichia coli DEC9B]EHW41897.1 hypothetical protein ECDEC9C_4359 [Escherichia coli DEC9C]EHW48175.1 hypothetical protein ECDEC9D_4597 [Escherichia coli DEC9D]